MAKDHYIPACFLGRFSGDNTGPYRGRPLHVLRRGGKDSFNPAAEKIGSKERFYETPNWPDVDVDTYWQRYEDSLNSALDRLVDSAGDLDGETWLRILVPFVASLFVRGPQFTTKFESQAVIKVHPQADDAQWMKSNTNGARMLSLQRLLAPVMAATWTVHHGEGADCFITNDLGFILSKSPTTNFLGISIPVSPRAVLTVQFIPLGTARKILIDVGDGVWLPMIEHDVLPKGSSIAFNELVAQEAREFIVGPTMASVRRQLPHMASSHYHEPDWSFLPSHRQQVVLDRAWLRAVSALQYPVEDLRGRQFDIDWKFVATGWHPMVWLAINLPQFQGELEVRGRTIELGMLEVPGFTDYAEYDKEPKMGAAPEVP